MSKTKFFAFTVISAMFFSCGSQDDGSPAALISKDLRISPFDTLVAEFNSTIVDLGSLKVGENIILSDNIKWVTPKETSSNKLKFVGTNETKKNPNPSPYFNADASGSITFKNLKNSEGYIMENAVLTFSTFRIIDDITNYKNDSEPSAIDLNSFFLNSTTVEFAGILDHQISGSFFNMQDFFTLDLRRNDVLKIIVNPRIDLQIQLTEPGKNSVNRTFTATPNKENEFSHTVGSNHLDDDDIASKEVPFYIKVFDGITNGPSNSYILKISRTRR